MTESVVQPGSDASREPGETITSREQAAQAIQEATPSTLPSTIIWTPCFMVIFGLILVLGLSVESLLTQGWRDGYFPGGVVLVAHIALVCSCWIAAVALAGSWWVRIGGIFGCIWALFMSINLVVNLYPIDQASPVLVHLNSAIFLALLGSYICFSLDHTPFQRWDACFFGLAFLVGSGTIVLTYLLTPAENRSLSTVESAVQAIALYLSIFVWWLRPSCWKTRPGLTFLFGIVPVILLLLSIPDLTTPGTNFFLTQVAFLCLFLAGVRILQGEIRN